MIHGTSAVVADILARGGSPEATVAVMLKIKCSMSSTGHTLNLARKHTIRVAGNALSGDLATNLMNHVG
jgi:hypothetical protein